MSEDEQLVRAAGQKPELEKPRWDQSTFEGRARHFLTITNPANLLASPGQLDAAKKVVEDFRKDAAAPDLTVGELWRAKHLYDSAFHPDTKEKMILIGRMSAQVPCNMAITGGMLTFYKSPLAVVFWQWVNQSFNAVVNYTNRSGDDPVPVSQLGTSYVAATGGALVTALGLNAVVKSAPPLVGRLVPLCAVAAANCINIPMMRRREVTEGIAVFDAQGNRLGHSPTVAKTAIAKVVVSRICMAAPSMALTPVLMNYLERQRWFRPALAGPTQVVAIGVLLTFATPLCCAIFPQTGSFPVDALEPGLRDAIRARPNPPTEVLYNKGL